MKFQAFHMNPGEKLKKKDVNNDLSNFMTVFPTPQWMTSCMDGPYEYVSQKKTSDTNFRKNFGMYKSIYKLFKLVLYNQCF